MKIPPLSRRWLLPALLVALATLLLGAGAATAFESDTVDSYWRGLYWAISLMTTVGFIGGHAPHSVAGTAMSVVLMMSGFLLLSLVSAALASLFVREDEEPFERRERAVDAEILRALADVVARLDALERRLPPTDG